MTRWAAKVDRNHAAIREVVRRSGRRWRDTFRFGGGFPDGLVLTKNRRILLVEVKYPGEQLTAAEREFHDQFPVEIWTSPEEALDSLDEFENDKVTLLFNK